MLAPGARAAVYWDDADKARELVVRPVPAGEEGDWHWSGAWRQGWHGGRGGRGWG